MKKQEAKQFRYTIGKGIRLFWTNLGCFTPPKISGGELA